MTLHSIFFMMEKLAATDELNLSICPWLVPQSRTNNTRTEQRKTKRNNNLDNTTKATNTQTITRPAKQQFVKMYRQEIGNLKDEVDELQTSMDVGMRLLEDRITYAKINIVLYGLLNLMGIYLTFRTFLSK